MPRRSERGFTLTELLLSVTILAFMAAVATDAIVRHNRHADQAAFALAWHESQARAIAETRKWLAFTSVVVPRLGNLTTSRQVVILKMPRLDRNGYREADEGLLVLDGSGEHGYRILVLPSSSRPDVFTELRFGGETGPCQIELFDASGKDTTLEPARTSSVRLSFGPVQSRFAVGRRP